jgi:hypothetical protein
VIIISSPLIARSRSLAKIDLAWIISSCVIVLTANN